MKTKTKPSINDILARNPHLDRSEALGAIKLRRQFRKYRVKGSDYGLASPSTQKRAIVSKDILGRMVNLRKASSD